MRRKDAQCNCEESPWIACERAHHLVKRARLLAARARTPQRVSPRALSGYQCKCKNSRSECLVHGRFFGVYYVPLFLFQTLFFCFTAGSRDDERSKLIPRPQHSWRQCRLTLLWSESVLPMMLRFVPIHGGVFQFLLFSSSQLQNWKPTFVFVKFLIKLILSMFYK